MLMQQHEATVKSLQETIKQLREELIQAQSGANTSLELEILASRQKVKELKTQTIQILYAKFWLKAYENVQLERESLSAQLFDI